MPSWSEARLRAGTAEKGFGDCKSHESKRKADATGEWEQGAVGFERFGIYTYMEENELYSWQTLRL
jgi:hypothetical protein